MSQTNLINSFVPGVPGLGSIALVALVLLTAMGVVFFAFHRRHKQIVGRGGLSFISLPRVIHAVEVVYGTAEALVFLLSPEGPPNAAVQSSGNSLKLRPGKGSGQIPLRATALSTRLLSLTWPCISI